MYKLWRNNTQNHDTHCIYPTINPTISTSNLRAVGFFCILNRFPCCLTGLYYKYMLHKNYSTHTEQVRVDSAGYRRVKREESISCQQISLPIK